MGRGTNGGEVLLLECRESITRSGKGNKWWRGFVTRMSRKYNTQWEEEQMVERFRD